MKRWLKVAVIVIAAAFLLMLAAGLIIGGLIDGTAKPQLIASIQNKAGVPVSSGRAGLDLQRWFLFQPVVTFRDVAIGNPPGFHSKNLLEAKKVSVHLALSPLFRKKVEMQSIHVDQARVLVETGYDGRTNIEIFLKAFSTRRDTEGSPVPDLSTTTGTVEYVGTKQVDVNEIDVHIRGLSSGAACQFQASAKLFRGGISSLKLAAQAGPFTPASLPIDGTLTLVIAPSDIPANLRQEHFGSLLEAPGPNSRVTLEASVKGDVYSAVSGPAKLALSSIMIGGHSNELMPLSGDASSTFTASNLMSSLEFQLNIPSMKLHLGNGEWNGSADLKRRDKSMSGELRGALRNLDINQFLTSFASASGKVYGSLAIPSSTFRFSGTDAAEIRRSLQGTAQLSAVEGRLAILDLPAAIEQALGRGLPTGESPKGGTSFSALTTALDIAHEKIRMADLLMDGPTLRVTGNGTIGFDHALDFDLVARVSSGRLTKLAGLAGVHIPTIGADMPLSVTGTIENPKVRPKVAKDVKQIVQAEAGVIRAKLRGKGAVKTGAGR